jgi:hypothetical protein
MSGVVLAPETTTGVASPQHANPKRTDDASTLAKDLLGVSLVPEIMVQSIPDVTSPPSIDQKVTTQVTSVSTSIGDEGYDPSRECFHVDQGDHDEDNHLGMPEDDNAPVPASRVEVPRELAVVPVLAGGQDTQLEQLREMQAKLDEEAGRLVQLRQNIEQEWVGRELAGGARHQARDI